MSVTSDRAAPDRATIDPRRVAAYLHDERHYRHAVAQALSWGALASTEGARALAVKVNLITL